MKLLISVYLFGIENYYAIFYPMPEACVQISKHSNEYEKKMCVTAKYSIEKSLRHLEQLCGKALKESIIFLYRDKLSHYAVNHNLASLHHPILIGQVYILSFE